MSTVFLIGMPGAGKSHWGKIWSRAHGFPLYDLDSLIEQRAGAAIPAIMQTIGESGFRTLETDVLQETVAAIAGQNAIVSCGGGTPTIGQNFSLMQRSGCIVYLEAPVEVLLRQLSQSAVKRPLLRDLSAARIEALLEARKSIYEQADLILPLSKAEAGTFAEILQACTNRRS